MGLSECPDQFDDDAHIQAVISNDYSLVKCYLQKGSSGLVNYRDPTRGWTALHVASWKGFEEIAYYLIRRTDIDLNIRTFEDEWSALHRSIAYGHFQIAEALVEAGATLDLQDHQGFSALMAMTLKRPQDPASTQLISMLIKNGANLDLKNKEGRSALILAVLNNHSRVAKVLLKNGANIDLQDNYGYTALMYAVEGGYATALTLLEYGANFELFGIDGADTLKLAIFHGRLDIVSIIAIVKYGSIIESAKNFYLERKSRYSSEELTTGEDIAHEEAQGRNALGERESSLPDVVRAAPRWKNPL